MTVKKQILIILVAFSVIPTILISSVRIGLILSTIESLHLNRLNAITRTSAAAFSEIVGLRKYEFSLLATSWNVVDYINAIDQHGIASNEAHSFYQAASDYFDIYVDTLSAFNDLVLLDAQGDVILGYHAETVGRNLADNDYFQRVINQTDPNYVFISKAHDYLVEPESVGLRCLALSKAFRSADGRLLGVLVAYVDTSIIAKFAKGISFGKTGLSFVMDSDNYLLFHPEARFYNSYTSAPQLANLLERYKKGEIPESGFINDLMDGRQRIYYYEVMPDCELILVLRQDYQEFAEERNTAIAFALISCTVIVLLAFLFANQYAKYFVKPIQKLKTAFASGEREGSYVVCELPHRNEFGELSDSYNTMIKKLERQYELLVQEKEKNEYSAMHDWVTGLYNRVAFEKVFTNLLSTHPAVGICFIDMDNFKQVNDLHGHPMGDVFLDHLAKKIQQSAGAFDLCARIGGDEFVVAKIGSLEDMRNAVHTFFDELKEPIQIGDLLMHASVSAGISHYPEHGQTADALITNADIAMYTAKTEGKNTSAVYTLEMRHAIDRHSSIMQVLRNCIDSKEAFLMYQPVYNASHERLLGFEALMRIKSATMGLISPLEFIPIAESDRDIMLPLGTWILRKACQFIKDRIEHDQFTGYVAVNISIMQLNCDNFVSDVLAILDESGVPPQRLQLEFTEHIIMSNMEVHIKKLALLREHGVLIALDDFVTKTSSLYSLSQLPIDSIKIDSSFIYDMDMDERVAFMNRAIVELAHRFEIKIVAEGVETQKEYDLLKTLGCDNMQGFLFSRPLVEESAILQVQTKVLEDERP